MALLRVRCWCCPWVGGCLSDDEREEVKAVLNFLRYINYELDEDVCSCSDM